MRNKNITTFPLLVGLVVAPLFATAADLESDQNSDIIPFKTLGSSDSSTKFFGNQTINLGDVNGDGYSDFLIQERQIDFSSGYLAHLYHGGPSLDNVPKLTFSGDRADGVAAVGDVNGDGYADIGLDGGKIVFGGSNMDEETDVALPGSSVPKRAGDVNGDGISDVIVGKSVFFGGNPMDIQADATFEREVTVIGDVNGDGYDDLASADSNWECVQIPDAYGGSSCGKGKGRVWLYYGGSTFDTTPNLMFTGQPRDELGSNGVRAAGDVNGDGFDDIAIESNGLIHIHYGQSIMSQTPDVSLLDRTLYGFAGNFDFNQDGFSDVAAGAYFGNSHVMVSVYFGGSNMNGIRDRLFITQTVGNYPRISDISGGRDITGDGIDDLLVGNTSANESKGEAYILGGEKEPGGPIDPPIACSVNEDFESGAAGWAPSSASTCLKGEFVLGTPTRQGNKKFVFQVGGDHTSGSGNAWFTAVNTRRGKDDVDNGTCILESPMWQVDEASNLSLWYFHGQKKSGGDSEDGFSLKISTDGGATFTSMVSIGDKRTNAAWTNATTKIPAGSEVTLSLEVTDGTSQKDLIEAGIDDIKICPSN